VSYKATLLHPTGATDSAGLGISGSQQVGHAGWSQYEQHALLWNGSADAFVDLHPPSFGYSQAVDVDGDLQVGYGTSPVTEYYDEHAMLWKGTADSIVDLHPEDETYEGGLSFATGVSGASQVGYVTTQGNLQERAFLWNGTAASAVNLQPSGFARSVATGIWGTSQVGWGATDYYGDVRHALLWKGTAESVIDLHPTELTASEVFDVWGAKQIGYGRGPAPGFYHHALLWNGSADDYVDLHPDGFMSSDGSAIAGEFQAGSGIVATPDGNQIHALAWNGSADSAIDLHQYLVPVADFLVHSYATGVDENGTIVGVAYRDGFDGFDGYAVLWTPVPEPNSCVLILCGLSAVAFAGNRERRRTIRRGPHAASFCAAAAISTRIGCSANKCT
jgi:hypothetical protein